MHQASQSTLYLAHGLYLIRLLYDHRSDQVALLLLQHVSSRTHLICS